MDVFGVGGVKGVGRLEVKGGGVVREVERQSIVIYGKEMIIYFQYYRLLYLGIPLDLFSLNSSLARDIRFTSRDIHRCM